MTPPIFHFSDDPNIKLFEPRTHASWPDLAPRVWAVEDRMLHTFLVPRDCPRVTYYALDSSTDEDVAIYLDGDRARFTVRVEQGWLKRIQQATLYLYRLPEETFTSFDAGAGYWVSDGAVKPTSMDTISNLPDAMTQRNVDFSPVPSLWPLFDAVAASTLQFSMIRMRFAQPR